MSFQRFVAALPIIEGGASNDPRDPGGPTAALGVTKASWFAGGHQDWPPGSPDEVMEWIDAEFWRPYVQRAQLPEPADSVFAQLVYNLPSRARWKALQAAIGATPDGKWGAESADALKLACAVWNGRELALLILAAQAMHYADVHAPEDWDFKGLDNRIKKVRKLIENGQLGG